MSQVLPLHLPTAPRGVILLDQNGDQVGVLANPVFIEPTGTGVQPVTIVSSTPLVLNATGQVSVGASATLIIALNANRAGVIITNPSTTVTVFLGAAGVTISTGQELLPGNSITIPVTSAIYGVVAASTQTVSFMEIE
jgi:hypothetical protein